MNNNESKKNLSATKRSLRQELDKVKRFDQNNEKRIQPKKLENDDLETVEHIVDSKLQYFVSSKLNKEVRQLKSEINEMREQKTKTF